jgi:hypothetical protein
LVLAFLFIVEEFSASMAFWFPKNQSVLSIPLSMMISFARKDGAPVYFDF